MLKLSVLPADTYVVVNKTIFSNNDRRVLMMLYQPIIGSDAINLYFTLWSFLDKNEVKSVEWTHHHLMVNMGFSLEKIISAREKLEGIGLVRTFVKKDNVNKYVYELYSPIDGYQFFTNPILNVALYNNLGKYEYEKTLTFFKNPRVIMSGYEDITCKFSDIFDSDVSSLDYSYDDIRRESKIGFNVDSKFDIESVLSLIPDEVLNHKSITHETRDLLFKLSFIYDLNEDSLRHIINNSINEKHNIDKDLLRVNSRKFYSFENSGKLPSLVYRNQPEYLRKPVGDTSKRARAIYFFETTSPYEFLYQKNNNTEPNARELKIIEDLMVDLNMNPGVVNVLIDYVLRINNNKLVKSFVLTVASQWVRSNVETVEQAMKIAEKEYKSHNKVVERKSSDTPIVPEWFNKKIEKSDVSNEEEMEFLEKIRRVRGEV
jgi:replication initiation and membrane attachment protein